MNAKAKGAQGEREACAWLERKVFGDVGLKRNLEQVRSGGADIIHHPLVFEVKRRKGNVDLGTDKFWIQVATACKRINVAEGVNTFVPVVMFRINKRDWEFLIPADTLYGLYVNDTPIFTQGYVRVNGIRFVEWAKHFIGK